MEADSSDKKRKGVPKEAPPMPMPRHGLWSNDTIISSKRIQNKTSRVRDEGNDSDEDNEDEEFGLPNYSQPGVMNHTSV